MRIRVRRKSEDKLRLICFDHYFCCMLLLYFISLSSLSCFRCDGEILQPLSRKSGSSPLSKASSKANVNASQTLENGTQGVVDWGSSAAPAHAWGVNDSVEQLKFRACLKILMTELRTLATGFEVDGGKLRFQLYSWLEKEIAAMHKICNYKVEGKEERSEVERNRTASVDISDEALENMEAGAYERHQMERRRLQAKQQHSERRKAWLRKNQALLRVFLSYCSLHGAKGGGVTSVRMELLFLLQESQQETTVKQLQSPLPLPTTLPLLSACIAPTKTVIANPVLHLSNHIHDILYTITMLEAPPHPDIISDRVNALHTLAASLSACVYQALCVSSLISLLTSAREEDQPRLSVLLCEAVVAVYLSLLIHGLGTHNSNELFRLAAHPLNNRMWAAVFGGGAKVIIKPKRPELPPGKKTI
ncbi:DmX-like protein 2 [Xenoophorus captivus]|uniref:DmX-like protein 2 n=1 Tax=Xenoophorus captivus TaxID=1517983 RepID=A0ABV0RGM4_9TELE